MFKPGKAEDILDDGSLQLKDPKLTNEGTYKAEVFNSDGKNILDRSFRLCMKGKSLSLFLSNHTSTVSSPLETLTFCFSPEKVSKPSVKITCSNKDIIFTCTLTNIEGVTFQWNQNGNPIDKKTEPNLTIPLKPQKKPDTFTCSAVNKVSKETSDAIKPICNGTECFKGLNRNSLCESLFLFPLFFSVSLFFFFCF